MLGRVRLLPGLLVLALSLCVGCEFGQPEELAFDDEIAELEATLGAASEEKSVSDSGERSALPQSDTTASLDADAIVGKTISLKKTVHQTMAQSSVDGLTTSQSRLDEWFDVTVTSNTPEERVFRVRYRWLRYWHQVPGETVTFDSSNTGQEVPAVVAPLVSLAKSGFTFHTDPGGVVTKVTGAPPGLFPSLPDPTVSLGFVQDRIGFMSLDLRTATGGSRDGLWMQNRHVPQPVAMNINTRFTLKTQDAMTLSLEVLGTMSSLKSSQPIRLAGASADVTFKGGHALGQLVIDRLTGLPLTAKWNRYLDLQVRCAGGEEFEQRKHEVVTIVQESASAKLSAPPPQPNSQTTPQPEVLSIPQLAPATHSSPRENRTTGGPRTSLPLIPDR